MTGRRPQRLAEQIKEEVSLIIAGEMEDPRVGLVTVTDAKLSPDLRHAKIFVSVRGTKEEIKASLAALKHAAGFIRTQLGPSLTIRYTPELHFVHDDSVETAARIEELLSEEIQKAREREQAQEPAADEQVGQGSNE
ncbi:MAG TPA: 30S ribosome-binding factor RbfA [Blastocatellia bacterium]|jgi:ribosome-binding factor A|nr:30S ribosome-binding factor RbfA [Blastocatellia bacterium]